MRKLRRTYQRNVKKRNKFKQKAIAAGTAAALTLGTVGLHKALAYTPDLHELPVIGDTDGDLLADPEELDWYVRLDPQIKDQNLNGIPDGVELAKHCAEITNQLPWDYEVTDPNQTYRWGTPVYGVEACDICGQMIHMGDGGIINPRLGLSVDCHPISVHYMEHGSFSYAGEVHSGRLDVPMLLRVLEIGYLLYEPNDHQLPVPDDADADLLSNKEETAIGYQPFNDDQNKNAIPDGIELAKRCAIVVSELPQQHQAEPNETYKIEHAVDGLERCYICGQWIHMGGWEIINPKLNLKYPDPNDPLDEHFLPDLALHYMEHGSFDCYGDIHQGRVNLQRLMRVLELRYPHEPNEHQLPLDYVVEPVGQLAPDANDLDNDLLANSEELAAGYNLYDPDQDEDLTPDGIELAKQCSRSIDELPIYDPYGGDPEPNEPYKICHFQYGLERCEICGQLVNMGWWDIVNPKLQLTTYAFDISCHYMSHGSFSYSGTQALQEPPYEPFHTGRLDIPLLLKILEMPRQCGDLGTIYLPGDVNKDCRENFADFAEFANKWLQSTDPNGQ